MKTSEIKELTTKELAEKITDEKVALQRLKMNHAVSPLESPMKIRHTRRLIAKLITELHSRNLKKQAQSWKLKTEI